MFTKWLRNGGLSKFEETKHNSQLLVLVPLALARVLGDGATGDGEAEAPKAVAENAGRCLAV